MRQGIFFLVIKSHKCDKERKNRMTLKERIEKVLSEILSDKHECKVTLQFQKQVPVK